MPRIDKEIMNVTEILDLMKFKIESFCGTINNVPIFIWKDNIEIRESGSNYIEIKNDSASISVPVKSTVENVRICYETI